MKCETLPNFFTVLQFLRTCWMLRSLVHGLTCFTASAHRINSSSSYVYCFGFKLPGLLHSVASSASAETLIAYSERNSFSFAKKGRISTVNSLKAFPHPLIFESCADVLFESSKLLPVMA